MLCTICEEGNAIRKSLPETFEWLNKEIITYNTYYICDYCGSERLASLKNYLQKASELKDMIKNSYSPEKLKQIVLSSSKHQQLIYLRHGYYYPEMDKYFK